MPVPLFAGAPGQPLLRVSVAWASCLRPWRLVIAILYGLLVMVMYLVLLSCLVLQTPSFQTIQSGPRDGTTPLGYQFHNGFLLGIALWGRFPWWGGLWPLGTKVLHNDSPEGRGGPWAPPPRIFFSKLFCFFLGLCLLPANCSLCKRSVALGVLVRLF